ncbi:MAG TPA: hypothetical protein ENN66_05680 [Proteobacteria bacterium]|nr:hypothetical protein [Pseudomonadota bacterium]
MIPTNDICPVQRVVVFQERGSGEKKIAGIEHFAPGCFTLEIISIDAPLPRLIDEPEDFLPATIEADLVLDFLRHPDLSTELLRRCRENQIPLVASTKKHEAAPQVATPPI